jgi:site-specific recombinase XerC
MRTADLDMSGEVWVYTPPRHKTEHHDKSRRVYLGAKAQQVLRPWLRADRTAYLFSPQEAVEEWRATKRRNRKTPLTPSQKARRCKRKPKRTPGARYDVRAYAHAIARACVRAFPHPTLAPLKPRDLDPARREELKATRRAIKSRRLTKEQRAELRVREGEILGLTREQQAELKAWHRQHRWHPNQIRHTFATRVRKEFDLDTARALLGHSKAEVTEIYAERDRGRAIDAVRRIG